MYRRKDYKEMIRYNQAIGRKFAEGKHVSDEPTLIIELLDRYNKLDTSYRQWTLEDGIRWMMGFANYVNEKNSNFKCKYAKHKFQKGDIILVDLFGHFGSELTYDHPAIVISDEFNGCIVAPISSTTFEDRVATHIDLPKNQPDLGKLKNNCAIKLEQLRYISKKRILQKFNRVSNNEKLKEIDETLMQHLAGFTYTKLMANEQQLRSTLETTLAEKEILENELKQLKERYASLEKQYQLLQNNS